jgi:hypothetical protein
MGDLMEEHKPNEATRAQVQALLSYGISQEEAAKYIGIDPKTLRKYYRLEIDTALTRSNLAVATSLFNNAVNDNNVSAQMFWLRTKGGFKEDKQETIPERIQIEFIKAVKNDPDTAN